MNSPLAASVSASDPTGKSLIGVTLADALEVMRKAGPGLCVAEIVRIGRAACEVFAETKIRNVAVAARADLIFLAPDGTVRVATPCRLEGQAPIPFNDGELTADLAELLLAMLKGGLELERHVTRPPAANRVLSTTPVRPHKLDSEARRWIRAINRFTDGTGSLRALSLVLAAPRTYSAARVGIRALLTIAAVAALCFQFNALRKAENPGPSTAAGESLVQESLTQATAAQAQWKAYASAHPGLAPQQTEDAERELQLANDAGGTSNYDEAQAHFGRATELYVAGLATAQRLEVQRAQSLASRARIDTALLRWRPLLRSSYVELPGEIQGGLDALVEGNLRFLQSRFEEALMAYDLGEQRILSVSAEKLERLLARNDAMAALDAARAAQSSWAQLAQATDLAPPPAVAVAKAHQAEGEALLSAGRDRDAAERLRNASGEFRQATDSVIAAIVAREQAADLKTRAVDAVTRWRAVATALKQENSADAAQAQTLMDSGAEANKHGDYSKAEQSFAQAAKLIEAEYQKLNSVAEGRVVKLDERIALLEGSLTEAEHELSERVAKAEQRVAAVQQRLGNPAAAHAGNLTVEEEFAIVVAEKLQLTKQSRFCSTEVFSGPRRRSAEDTLVKARALRIQGDYTAACVLMEQCVADLNTLSRLPSESEAFLAEEAQVVKLTTSIPAQLGPIARAATEVVSLLNDANESLRQARDVFHNGNPMQGRQMLGDAKMALQSLIIKARSALIQLAIDDEATLRFDDARAALREEMTIDPTPTEAQRLLETIQSLIAQPREQIFLLHGKLRIGPNALGESPVFKDFERVLGEPARKNGNVSYLYDDRGIVLIPDVGSEHIRTMMIYFMKPVLPHEPTNIYKGLFEIEGYVIGRADAIDKINASTANCQFAPNNLADGAYRARYGAYTVRINYEPGQPLIATIAVDFKTE